MTVEHNHSYKTLKNSLTQSKCLVHVGCQLDGNAAVMVVGDTVLGKLRWGICPRSDSQDFLGKVTLGLRHSKSKGLAKPEWMRVRWGRGSHFRQREQHVQSFQEAKPKAQKGQEVVW